MYIRKKTVRKNGKTYTYEYMQESYRDGGKVKTRHLGLLKRILAPGSAYEVGSDERNDWIAAVHEEKWRATRSKGSQSRPSAPVPQPVDVPAPPVLAAALPPAPGQEPQPQENAPQGSSSPNEQEGR